MIWDNMVQSFLAVRNLLLQTLDKALQLLKKDKMLRCTYAYFA